MEKHDPRKINEKIRNLTREQSKALSASLNENYIKAELERKGKDSETTLLSSSRNDIREIPMRDKEGELLCVMRYCPESFIMRSSSIARDNYANFVDVITKTVKLIADIGITPDGNAVDEEHQAELDRIEREITAALNRWFGTDSATEIFAVRKPFASVGGKFFIQQIINVVDHIQQQV